MVVADLHVHTTNSDGQLGLDDVPAAAEDAELEAVAITDHDRPHPGLDAPVQTVDGVTLVHGIELRVATESQRVDLLGYGLDPTRALRSECERIQRDRVERGRRIVECVEDRLGVDLHVEPREGLGRPHIARAVAEHPDLGYDVERVFAELIGDGRPCYVARDVPGFDQGRDLLADACALVGLAHPLRYEDPEAALELTETLDAVELHYPYDRPVDPDDPGSEPGGADRRTAVKRVVERYGLLETGGSDAHGMTLGTQGLDVMDWKRVAAALGS